MLSRALESRIYHTWVFAYAGYLDPCVVYEEGLQPTIVVQYQGFQPIPVTLSWLKCYQLMPRTGL
jgi:hypothetical protein